MNLLFVGLNFAPEPVGVSKYSSDLVSWLSSNGHSVTVVTGVPYFPGWSIYNGFPNRYSKSLLFDSRIYRCPVWIPKSPTGLTRLLHLLSFSITSFPAVFLSLSRRPDVCIVIAPSLFSALTVQLSRCLLSSKTKFVLHIQDFEIDAAFGLGILKGRLLRSLVEKVERAIYCRFHLVSTISEPMLRRLHLKGVSHSQSLYFPNWIDLSRHVGLSGDGSKSIAYRNELNIPADHLVLMYSGSMNQKQGLDDLVEVIQLLSDIPNLTWVFAGEGPAKSKLVKLTSPFPNVLHFPLQPVELMHDWLSLADIHLLPQKAQAADLVLPSKLLGILGSARPLIASSPKKTALAFYAEQAGCCVPPGDAAAFAESLRWLICHPEERERLGQQGFHLASTQFERNLVLTRFENELFRLFR